MIILIVFSLYLIRSHLDSIVSISKKDKSNSMLSNREIWDVNNNQDDANVFYNKIEKLKTRRCLTNNLTKQLEDYNDDLDERVDSMKTDHIQQISNKECKLNNLRQISVISETEIKESINPNFTNPLLNSIDKAKYFTPKHLRVNGNNEIMKISIVPRQLHFAPQSNLDFENSKTHSPTQFNSYEKTIIFPANTKSKYDYPYQPYYPNYSQIKVPYNIGRQMNENYKGKFQQAINNNNQSFATGTNEVISQKINIEDIIIGKDKRTTLMLRNIPNKYTLSNILDEISSSFWGKYDYINLPIDNERKLNLGYAFINFTDPLHIILFYDTYRSKKWLKYKSDKKMDMNYADKQGKKENNGKDFQSYYADEDKRFNLATLQIKTEIPIKHLDFFKKIFPNSVCIVEDKNGLYNDNCFVVKSNGRK